MKKNQRQVITLAGKKLIVNISDRACNPFGFKHQDPVLIPNGQEAIIIGVGPIDAPSFAHRDVLWYAKTDKNGKVGYWSPLPDETNLKEQGFKLIEKAPQ